MRQAGRYLPEYMAVKENSDFMTMCKTPELAAEVTVQPIDIIGVDAAILFSDILVIPMAMGMHIDMEAGVGPVFEKPIKNEADAAQLKDVDVYSDLKYVMDGVSLVKKELDGRVPLIGFSGSPWTLFTYMIEGQGSKHFRKIKSLIFNNPKLAHSILEKLATVAADYLSAKIEAGVNAVQIFDTWGGLLSQHDYSEFSLRYIKDVISKIKRNDEPVITFSKGVHHSLEDIFESGTDVIGLDWTMDLGTVRKMADNRVALQGNMDPCALFADKANLKKEVVRVLESYGHGNGHIFNLGHGIMPDTDPEMAKELVKLVKEESVRFHQ
jgi:uroporphyrinogen decarboxylase